MVTKEYMERIALDAKGVQKEEREGQFCKLRLFFFQRIRQNLHFAAESDFECPCSSCSGALMVKWTIVVAPGWILLDSRVELSAKNLPR